MSKGKLIVGLFSISLLVLVPFIYNQVFGAENKMNSEIQQEVSYESEALNYNDLVRLISNSLLETGYGLSVDHRDLPDNRYLIQVKLPRYNVTQKVTEELMQQIENVIKENNFDREHLLIKVTSYIDKAEQSSSQEQEELDTFYKDLNEDGGFFEQVGKELDKARYSYEAGYSIVGMVYSTNDVSLQIIAENEKVTEKTQVEINRIFKDKITKFKLNGVAFTVNAIHISELNE
ncbi:hypothetical protein ACIQ7N_12340 [Lysinibacillus sp. NPDC095746]|uniref:hypothetical protein n=1 Tax=Lysinibacillus sp. NPDC095746 TaxID=3364134 RepID=UPI00381DB08E